MATRLTPALILSGRVASCWRACFSGGSCLASARWRQQTKTMRSRIVQNEKNGAPLGIRTGVWLTVFGLLLLCMVAISLSRRSTTRPAGETASSSGDATRQDSSASPQANGRRTTHKYFAPEVYESGARLPAILTAEEARSKARDIANEKAKELYDCEPFGDGPVSLDETGWVWSERRAYGRADIEARVSFAPDGSAPNVAVRLLLLQPPGGGGRPKR